jgi:hypothetical protein
MIEWADNIEPDRDRWRTSVYSGKALDARGGFLWALLMCNGLPFSYRYRYRSGNCAVMLWPEARMGEVVELADRRRP